MPPPLAERKKQMRIMIAKKKNHGRRGGGQDLGTLRTRRPEAHVPQLLDLGQGVLPGAAGGHHRRAAQRVLLVLVEVAVDLRRLELLRAEQGRHPLHLRHARGAVLSRPGRSGRPPPRPRKSRRLPCPQSTPSGAGPAARSWGVTRSWPRESGLPFRRPSLLKCSGR
jgi:hypothetical protein